MDLLHISCALHLHSKTFLTFDKLQAKVARAEGMDVPTLSD